MGDRYNNEDLKQYLQIAYGMSPHPTRIDHYQELMK